MLQPWVTDRGRALTTMRIDSTFVGKAAAKVLGALIDRGPLMGPSIDVGFAIVT